MSHETINVDEHIRLVQLQTDQADTLFELTDKNREYLGRFLPWPSRTKTVEDSRKYIEETVENRAKNITYTYGIEFDGNVVGDISLRNLQDEEKPTEIGYWIASDYSGRGLTTKSVQALTNLGLKTLGINKIIIRADPENGASNKVAEKAGYTLVGQDVDNDKTLNVWEMTK